MRIFTEFLLAAGLLTAGPLFAADAPATAPLRKVAIIVENRAGAQLNDKVAVLEDLLSSRIAGKGYSLISRDVVINALKTYPATGIAASSEAAVKVTAGTSADQGSAALEVAKSGSAKVAVTPDTTQLDQMLSDNTSALRLAQNLGADFILIPSLTTYGTEKKAYTGDGISTVNVTHTLRVSYKIVEAGAGGAIKGDTVTAAKTIRQSGNLSVDSSEVINELLDDAAGQLAGTLVQNAGSLPTEIAKEKLVSFRVACTMTDPRQQPILISALGVTADNRVVVTNQPIAVQPMDVTVELDGVAIGSAPGSFQGFPGLHKLRLSREGFDAWERTVNIYDGQNLRVALQMSPEGYARWKETTDFLATLDSNRKLTDAEAKRLEGLAKFFSESHYRVDTKENIKIYKSLF
jgi:hypothetical protein